jgi:flavin reductase (DIM6/NTAB) family NADH-FMN oxidoreductase RutF
MKNSTKHGFPVSEICRPRVRLTADEVSEVKAPLIRECYANLEWRLYVPIDKYNVFIFEVVKAHAPASEISEDHSLSR